eukprot:NODE_16038_length_1015_cov_16.773649.p1 GENE.NODE_16038_length_1015_cov_16.773649~~NODE_16038_length_1015_cov_16.773649.p1  ORF type:complete len:299 (+),score=13.45 NODE_16038_length_1015_cov_16.773649:41-937(+)
MWSPRALVHKDVEVCVYEELLTRWLATAPIVCIATKLGPRVAQDVRQVTPSDMSHLAKLVMEFIDAGVANCVLQSSRLRAGLTSSLMSKRWLVGSWSLDEAVTSACTHIMNVFRAFREWAKEDLIVKGARRYPHTGGLRKKALAMDMEAIFPVLAKLHNQVGHRSCVDLPCALLDAPSARSSDPPLDDDDDDDEMPPEFLEYFAARPLNPSAKRRKAAVVEGRQHGGCVDTAPLLSCQVCITKEDRPRAEMRCMADAQISQGSISARSQRTMLAPVSRNSRGSSLSSSTLLVACPYLT